MSNLNKVILMGRVSSDIRARDVNSAKVATFSLAINRTAKKKDGTTQQETCFVDIETWGKLADIAGQYLKKGSPVLIEGRLKFSQWQDKTTQENKSKHTIYCEELKLVNQQDAQDSMQEPDEAEVASASPTAPKPQPRPAQTFSKPAYNQYPPKTQPAQPKRVIDPNELPF